MEACTHLHIKKDLISDDCLMCRCDCGALCFFTDKVRPMKCEHGLEKPDHSTLNCQLSQCSCRHDCFTHCDPMFVFPLHSVPPTWCCEHLYKSPNHHYCDEIYCTCHHKCFVTRTHIEQCTFDHRIRIVETRDLSLHPNFEQNYKADKEIPMTCSHGFTRLHTPYSCTDENDDETKHCDCMHTCFLKFDRNRMFPSHEVPKQYSCNHGYLSPNHHWCVFTQCLCHHSCFVTRQHLRQCPRHFEMYQPDIDHMNFPQFDIIKYVNMAEIPCPHGIFKSENSSHECFTLLDRYWEPKNVCQHGYAVPHHRWCDDDKCSCHHICFLTTRLYHMCVHGRVTLRCCRGERECARDICCCRTHYCYQHGREWIQETRLFAL